MIKFSRSRAARLRAGERTCFPQKSRKIFSLTAILTSSPTLQSLRASIPRPLSFQQFPYCRGAETGCRVRSRLYEWRKGEISYFFHQRFGSDFHAIEGKPLFAQVFQRCSEMINRVINTQKTVVRVGENFHFDC